MHIVIKSLALNSYDMDPGENNVLPGPRPSSFPVVAGSAPRQLGPRERPDGPHATYHKLGQTGEPRHKNIFLSMSRCDGQ